MTVGLLGGGNSRYHITPPYSTTGASIVACGKDYTDSLFPLIKCPFYDLSPHLVGRLLASLFGRHKYHRGREEGEVCVCVRERGEGAAAAAAENHSQPS